VARDDTRASSCSVSLLVPPIRSTASAISVASEMILRPLKESTIRFSAPSTLAEPVSNERNSTSAFCTAL
jgi:hypothetical protein